jgi:hypothetical protein
MKMIHIKLEVCIHKHVYKHMYMYVCMKKVFTMVLDDNDEFQIGGISYIYILINIYIHT